MSYFTGLRCRMCGTGFPAEALFVCDQCLGPLEVTYDIEDGEGHQWLIRLERPPALPGE